MIGILTVTHGNFGQILAETVEFILDKKIECTKVRINRRDKARKAKRSRSINSSVA